MKGVLYSAAIGAGIALVAFAIDWLADRLDEMDEPEPLWPASKPYSRTYSFDDLKPSRWPPTDEEKARITAWVTEERAKAVR